MRACTSRLAFATSRPRSGLSFPPRCVSNSHYCLHTHLRISNHYTHTNQTTQAIIKDTLSARKNTSPQNIYEVGQLYAAGALKAACIGLQCIGFDEKLYHALLFQADVCAKTGRWRPPVMSNVPAGASAPGGAGTGGGAGGGMSGLGTGAVWNISANAEGTAGPPGIAQALEAEVQREGQKTPSIGA